LLNRAPERAVVCAHPCRKVLKLAHFPVEATAPV
jgi:hypothetical protein